ncbi:MAG: 5-carboxymethyl-2-hydroxymuconate Delta-isomerase [Geminicoccaceae bacterium]
MPHLIVEYSGNLEGRVDMRGLCDTLRRAAIETGVFPMPGIRVRAVRCDIFSIADGNPENAFIDISIRLRAGREMDAKKRATEAVFEAARTFLAAHFSAIPLALSLEMRDIDPELSPKCGSIREHLARREQGEAC